MSQNHSLFRLSPNWKTLQVRGSYWTDPGYKLKYDKLYIETMSPWLDIKLLFLSVWVAIKRVLNGSDVSVIEEGSGENQAK